MITFLKKEVKKDVVYVYYLLLCGVGKDDYTDFSHPDIYMMSYNTGGTKKLFNIYIVI